MKDRLVTFLGHSEFEHVLELLRTPENNENINAISAARCFIYVKQVRHALHSIPPRRRRKIWYTRLEVLASRRFTRQLTHK